MFTERARGSAKNREVRPVRWIRSLGGECGLLETSPEMLLRKEDQEAKEVPCNRLSHPDRIENIIRLVR